MHAHGGHWLRCFLSAHLTRCVSPCCPAPARLQLVMSGRGEAVGEKPEGQGPVFQRRERVSTC